MAGNYRSSGGLGRTISKGVRTLRNTKDMKNYYTKSRADKQEDTKIRQERKSGLDIKLAREKGSQSRRTIGHKAKKQVMVEGARQETARVRGEENRKTTNNSGRVKIRVAKEIEKVRNERKSVGGKTKKTEPPKKRRVAHNNKI